MIQFYAKNINIEFDQVFEHKYPFRIRAKIYAGKDVIGYTTGLYDEVKMCCTTKEMLIITHAKVCFGDPEFSSCGEILTQEVQIIGNRINIVPIDNFKECV